MRRLECARPARTTICQARNAGEAVQQLAHVARERQRLGQERKALMRRIRKIDARLRAITAVEQKLLPLMRHEADSHTGTAAPLPAPSPRRQVGLPIGFRESTLQY